MNFMRMVPKILLTVLCLFDILIVVLGHPHVVKIPKLLIISFDGFRWDYLNRFTESELPNLLKFRSEGTYAEKGIKNVFITKTFPNHLSIVTGLYEESHGLVSNNFYDPLYNETYVISNKRQAVQRRWCDNGGEPIWVTNEKYDVTRRSGSAFWPCSTAPIKGYLPSTFLLYDKTMDPYVRIDTLINWFTDKSPINLGLLYLNEPDHTAHGSGPDSPMVNDAIRQLDVYFGYLVKRLRDKELYDDLNIIITSDHGMASLPPDGVMYMDDYISEDMCEYVFGGIIVSITPKKGRLEEVYQAFKKAPNCDVYKKSEIPEHYHYSHNRRIPPILVVAHLGYQFVKNRNVSWIDKGGHGYNNSRAEMHPFFMARGPRFKQSSSIETFHTVDIYGLMCHILGVKPAANNGSLDRVMPLLRETDDSESGGIVVIYFAVVPICLCLAGIFCVATCCQNRISRRRYQEFTNSIHSTYSTTTTPFTKLPVSDEDDLTRAMISESEDDILT